MISYVLKKIIEYFDLEPEVVIMHILADIIIILFMLAAIVLGEYR